MSMQNTIAELIQKHEVLCVRTLADKFGFDPLEAMASLPRGGAMPPLSKKAAKKATQLSKKVPKADKNKRAPTGYLLFCQAERPSTKSENPDMKPQEIIRELARKWKDLLSEEDRDSWKTHAKDFAIAKAQVGSDEESEDPAVIHDHDIDLESDLELEDNQD